MNICLRKCSFRNFYSIKFIKNSQRKYKIHHSVITPNKYEQRTLFTKYLQFSTVQSIYKNPEQNSKILFNNFSCNVLIAKRCISLSSQKTVAKPSSKVECCVQALKDKKQDKSKNDNLPQKGKKEEKKKTMKQRIVDELWHYYHGFRLLFIDIKISTVLAWRILNGKTLTRREHKLLIRTTGDMFRLVPFSVFIVVPFLEFTLPFFLIFFPNMLPSTFQTAKDKEEKLKKNLKIKLDMAKFLQKTLDEMAVKGKGRDSKRAKNFAVWFHCIRTTGEKVTNKEIMTYSKLFEDEITLDSLTRGQLQALCRVLEVNSFGTTNVLRFLLQMKLRSLAADDEMIVKEGVDSLNFEELQNACRDRGMNAYNLSVEDLRNQLCMWLDLRLNKKVPTSLLLLSRALMIPKNMSPSDQLKATISVLPVSVCTKTSAAIAEKEGKICNKIQLAMIKEEERQCKEERKEQTIEKTACKGTAAYSDQICAKDIAVLEDALHAVSKNKCIVEKECIQDLKNEMADYKEDVQELTEVCESSSREVKERKAAKLLFNSVNKMIKKMDCVIADLECKGILLKRRMASGSACVKKEDIIKIDDLIAAVKKLQKIPDESVCEQIHKMLSKLDNDLDGSVKVEDVLKIIEIVGKENVKLNCEEINEIIDLLYKEENLLNNKKSCS